MNKPPLLPGDQIYLVVDDVRTHRLRQEVLDAMLADHRTTFATFSDNFDSLWEPVTPTPSEVR